MGRKLLEKLKESVLAVGPIVLIVLALHFTVAPLPVDTLTMFLAGAALLVVGISIFTLGSDTAMTPMGELIGAKLTQSRKILLIILGCFVLGFAVTIAEPDLQVLVEQVPSIQNSVLLFGVAGGTGLFLVLAVMRIVFQFKLRYSFLILYGLLFAASLLTNPKYIPVGFDSGGVTTGPITVPFILALGVGISAVRSGKSAEEDSFGLTGICSIGPIIAVLIMGMFFNPDSKAFQPDPISQIDGIGGLLSHYVKGMFHTAKEVVIAILPILVIFILFQFVRLKLPKNQLIRILIGVIYTLAGLTIFLTGANYGFVDAGKYIGQLIAGESFRWILVPLGAVIGCCIILAEPAVHVLNKQVEEITGGSISKRMMMIGMAAGVGIAVALSMLRTLTGIPVWIFFVCGYITALVLSFVVPSMFTAIAFDSGGVASGTMSATFVLPLTLGVCEAMGGNIMSHAFGVVGLIAMMPPVTIQLMGLMYKIKMHRAGQLEAEDDTGELVISVESENPEEEKFSVDEKALGSMTFSDPEGGNTR